MTYWGFGALHWGGVTTCFVAFWLYDTHTNTHLDRVHTHTYHNVLLPYFFFCGSCVGGWVGVFEHTFSGETNVACIDNK